MLTAPLAVLPAVLLFSVALSILIQRASGRSPLFNIVLAVVLAAVGAVVLAILVRVLEAQVGW